MAKVTRKNGGLVEISKSSDNTDLEHFSVPTCIVDREGSIIGANRLFGQLLPGRLVILEDPFVKYFTSESFDSGTIEDFIKSSGAETMQCIRLRPPDPESRQRLIASIAPWTASPRAGLSIIHLLPDPGGDHASEPNRSDLDILIEERTAELNELNRFLTAIVDSSTETFIIAVGSNGLILSFNEGACHLFQRSKTEVIGREHIQSFFDERERAGGTWDQMIAEAQSLGLCRRMVDMVKKDARVFPALTDLTLLRNAEDQVLGMLFVGRDVTESQITQIALEQRKQELEFINTLALEIRQSLNPEDIGSIALRNTLRILQGNVGGIYLRVELDEEPTLVATEASEEMKHLISHIALTPHDHAQLEEGRIILRRIPPADPAAAARHDELNLLAMPLTSKTKQVGSMVLIIREPLAETEELSNFVTAIGATIGAAVDNAILYADTVKKSAEIKRQNRELDEFAYIVSHDLREPLAGIRFISKLLLDEYFDSLDTVGQQYVESVVDFSKRLDTLIETLLDLSRIGRIIQPPEEVDISQVVKEVRQNFSHKIEGKGRLEPHIRFIKPISFPPVFGDKTRITQVFSNLISNAIKFNASEHPVVEIGYEERDASSAFVTFFVRDNGIGIEEEYFDKIFKIFERLHSREEYEGTGAGLTIVKKIVEHHGGRIWLESVLDAGTTFYFTLPRYTPDVS